MTVSINNTVQQPIQFSMQESLTKHHLGQVAVYMYEVGKKWMNQILNNKRKSYHGDYTILHDKDTGEVTFTFKMKLIKMCEDA